MCISFRLAVLAVTLAVGSSSAMAQQDWPGQNPEAAAAPVMADPSSRVGSLSLVEGKVSFRAAGQAEAIPASLNWPVTSTNTITTARGAHAELRVGSSVLHLNGDTALEVTQLSDQQFQLRLYYGSLGILVVNPEVVRDLQISTAQGRVRLSEVARLRIDADLSPDTTTLSVSSGGAQFEGNGSSVSVRAGKRLEVRNDSLRSMALQTDSFDDWRRSREQIIQAAATLPAARYVSPETTGYEELDRNGDWRMNDEYGPLWAPRNVASDWVPYRDGSWTWVAPWGWTWVDNAPWGYAPSHYGRWVVLNQRWYWAPGQVSTRPVWAPALVGWVGGSNWNVAVAGSPAPAVGWFPLAPREAYVPHYPGSRRYVEQLNASHTWGHHPGQPIAAAESRQYRYASDALTVLPQRHFSGGVSISVSSQSRIVPSREQLQRAPLPQAPVLPMAAPVLPARDSRHDEHLQHPMPASAPVSGPMPAPMPAPKPAPMPAPKLMPLPPLSPPLAQPAATLAQPKPGSIPAPTAAQPVAGPMPLPARNQGAERATYRDDARSHTERPYGDGRSAPAAATAPASGKDKDKDKDGQNEHGGRREHRPGDER